MAKLRHRRILFLLLITPVLLLIELAIGLGVYRNIQTIDQAQNKSTKLDTYLRTNTKYISNAESAQRGYLLTGDRKFSETFDIDMDEIRKNEEYYNTLPADIKQSINKTDIRAVSKRKLSEMAITIQLSDSGKRADALTLINTGTGKRMMDSIRASTTAMRNQISAQVAYEKERIIRLLSLFLGLIAMLLAFNIFLVWLTYRTISNYAQNLEESVASLTEANHRMSQYTTMSYHELKTPLRNISGFAQLLKRKLSDDETSEEHEFAQYITDGIRQMDQTINDMRSKYLDDKAIKENKD